MRCIFVKAFCCAMLLPFGSISAAILPGNFLPNPGVEEDTDGDEIPDGWLRGGNDPAGDVWDSTEPYSGTHSLLLQDEGDASYTSWYTNVDVPEDTDELRFQWTWRYVFTSENPSDEFRMTIAWRSAGSDIGYSHTVVRDDQPDWKTEDIILPVPPTTDALRLEFVTGGPQTETGLMYIDDISIAIPGETVPGDFNGDSSVDVADIDLLTEQVLAGTNDAQFDLNADQLVNTEDRRVWVEEIKRTYYGDANLNGEFNSSDLVDVFQIGQYEDGVAANSGWAAGDWNGDREFDSSDFVTAFQAGGYEQGPRAAVAASAIPEPGTGLLAGIALLISGLTRRISRG